MENNQNEINTQDIFFLKGYLEDYLKNYADYWQPNREGRILCRNPYHPESRPSMSLDKKHNKLHCFSCEASYSLIDLIIIDYEIGKESENETEEQFKERLKNHTNIAKACNKIRELFNLESYKPQEDTGTTTPKPTAKAPEPKEQEQPIDKALEAAKGVIGSWEHVKSNFLGSAHYDYLASRGINDTALIDALRVYSLKNNPNKLFIPYQINDNLETVTERNLEQGIDKENRYKHHGKALSYDPFNYLISNAERVIFICEGEIDAISLYSCIKELKAEGAIKINCGAVALGGVNFKRQLMKRIEQAKDKTSAYFVMCLDNDKRGKDCAHELKIMMQEANLNVTDKSPIATGQEEIKDPNDLLRANKELLKANIKEIINNIKALCQESQEELLKAQEEENKAKREEFINTHSVLNYLNDFKASLGKDKTIKTFIPDLDTALNGGLREGVFTVGAVSSLGKTSFILQIADQLAQSQKDILYISLEMSKKDLIAKSLSRLMYLYAPNSDYNLVLTQSQILEGRFSEGLKDKQQELFNTALESYKGFASHLFYKDYDNFKVSLSVENIKEYAQEIKKYNTHAPIIVIDYLQMLGTPEPSKNLTDKQIIDQNILLLTSLAHELHTTIILISSLNRASYGLDVDLQSFKESGAIEYSSEAILGLNYSLTDEEKQEFKNIRKDSKDLPESEKQKAINDYLKEVRAKTPRHIKVDILKNRKGSFNQNIELKFWPQYNIFLDNNIDTQRDLRDLAEYANDAERQKRPFNPLPF